VGNPRQSSVLPHRSAAHFQRAVSFASEIGRPLLVSVDLNYGLTGSHEEDMSAAFRWLLKSRFVKWHNRHPRNIEKAPATYAWVAEGLPNKHGIHWLLALPSGTRQEFERLLPSWLERTAGPIISPDAILVKDAWNARRKADYMLKGLSPAHAARFGVDHVAQGVVFGKRCGYSENLGPTAIARQKAADAAAAVHFVG
jgi:hypothetical protein